MLNFAIRQGRNSLEHSGESRGPAKQCLRVPTSAPVQSNRGRESGLVRTRSSAIAQEVDVGLLLEAPVREGFQILSAARVAHFTERFRFYLANAFASDVEHTADFFERTRVAIAEAKTEA